MYYRKEVVVVIVRKVALIVQCSNCKEIVKYDLFSDETAEEAWDNAQAATPFRHTCKSGAIGFAYPVRISVQVYDESDI